MGECVKCSKFIPDLSNEDGILIFCNKCCNEARAFQYELVVRTLGREPHSSSEYEDVLQKILPPFEKFGNGEIWKIVH